MFPDSLGPIAKQWCQITLFAGCAWLPILVLRKDSSRVRHCKKLSLLSMSVLALVIPIPVGPLGVPLVVAQTVSATTARFEVASIKARLDRSGDLSLEVTPAGRVTAHNYTVWNLIRTAYGLRELQMTSGPAWIKSRGFDIQAQPTHSEVQVPREEVKCSKIASN
jgi:hypothetical protein